MIGIAARAPAALVERARRLYTGVDPDTRAPLTEADVHRMTGEAIARACDVHPHTVDGWIRRFAWSRPPWYRQPSGRRKTPPGAVMTKMRAAIEASASAGTALPHNFQLAQDFGCSIQAVRWCLRRLRDDGELVSERDGPRRRLVLKDGRTTGWTALPLGEGVVVRGTTVERRSLGARVLAAVTGWAAQGRPMPSDEQGGRLIGCDPSSFRRELQRLRQTGKLTVEHPPGGQGRRFVLPDGTATGWSVGQFRTKPVDTLRLRALRPSRGGVAPLDLAVEEAVRSLRRQGPVVYDLAVVTGCAPGVAWSVDGRTMNRDQLLAAAAAGNARAMQRLAGDLAVPA
jgi:hypothetical protein